MSLVRYGKYIIDGSWRARNRLPLTTDNSSGLRRLSPTFARRQNQEEAQDICLPAGGCAKHCTDSASGECTSVAFSPFVLSMFTVQFVDYCSIVPSGDPMAFYNAFRYAWTSVMTTVQRYILIVVSIDLVYDNTTPRSWQDSARTERTMLTNVTFILQTLTMTLPTRSSTQSILTLSWFLLNRC